MLLLVTVIIAYPEELIYARHYAGLSLAVLSRLHNGARFLVLCPFCTKRGVVSSDHDPKSRNW